MTFPSLDTAREVMDAAEARARFWHEHYGELLADYAEKFVAVQDGQVVAAQDNLSALILVLSVDGIDIRNTWVRFITAIPNNMLL